MDLDEMVRKGCNAVIAAAVAVAFLSFAMGMVLG